jgi:hypothetical protein
MVTHRERLNATTDLFEAAQNPPSYLKALL